MPTSISRVTIGSSVSLRKLTKRFGGREVLRGIDLDIGPGEFLAVLGPSGSGKTTVMRIIAGFEAPDSGTVEIRGVDVTTLPAEKRPVNTVFQSYALFPHMSVLENVAFGPRMRGLGRAQRERKARELLDLVRLGAEGERMPRELSGGMQQRVALARALANEPDVLLLDEPLGALDRKLREELQRELRRIHQELSTTFIYVTHDQEEAFGLADRLALMRDGRFVQVGNPGEVYDSPATAWVANFLGSTNSIPVRLGADRQPVAESGPLRADYVDPTLLPGETGLAIIRPEDTRIGPAAIAEDNNRIAGSLVDLVALGHSLRLKAVTADGRAFESVASRASAAKAQPGDAVSISFPHSAVRVYRPEADASHPV